jgi:DNA-binding GntR family transcriptional regulator
MLGRASLDAESETASAVEIALRSLRRMIFDGELKANQPLRQDELAARLGLSRHPVREALGRLSGEGLVTFRERRGYIVTPLAPDEVAEIFDMRAVLEEHAGYLATTCRKEADIDRVHEIIEKMRKIAHSDAPRMSAWSDCNRDFHTRLFEASGRRHLCRTISTLRDSVETYIRMSWVPAKLGDALRTHEEIFEYFRDGDALQVARLCRRHVRHSAEGLIDRLRAAHSAAVR